MRRAGLIHALMPTVRTSEVELLWDTNVCGFGTRQKSTITQYKLHDRLSATRRRRHTLQFQPFVGFCEERFPTLEVSFDSIVGQHHFHIHDSGRSQTLVSLCLDLLARMPQLTWLVFHQACSPNSPQV